MDNLLNGFLIINKPKGWTSFDVVARLRRILGVKKIGHTGTLDPLATGVLVVAVGKATRLLEYLMGWDKEYEAEFKFGWVSDTYDVEGKLRELDFEGEVSLSQVKVALNQFRGEIEQVPPSFSAIKVKGKKAYELARQGKEVVLKARRVQIYKLEILDYEFPCLRMRIQVSKGTYIRSLGHDLGQVLGCGVILTELKRTAAGEFELSQAQSLEEIEMGKARWIFLEEMVKDWPRLDLMEEEFERVKHGQAFRPVFSRNSTGMFGQTSEKIAAFYENKLVATLEPGKQPGEWKSRKLFQT